MITPILLDTVEIPGGITLVLTIAGWVAGFIVAYIYLRSGIESKKADGYKALFEIEEARAAKYELAYTKEKAEHLITKQDYEALALEFGSLSELFAKKSIVLEAFTGTYGGAAKAIEHLQAEGKLALPKALLPQNSIHLTDNG